MTTFILYQPPRTGTPAFKSNAIRSSAPHGLPAFIPDRRSWQRTEWDRIRPDGSKELVGLRGSDRQKDPVLERQAAGGKPDRAHENSAMAKGGSVENSTQGTKGTGGDDNDDSEDDDLPSLEDLISKAKRKTALARSNLCLKRATPERLVDNRNLKSGLAAGDEGAAANTRAGFAAVSGSLCDSQDEPIMLDDDEPHAAAPDDGGRSLGATRIGGQPGSSPSPSDLPSEIVVGGLGVHSAPADSVNGRQNLNNGNGQYINGETIDNRERSRPAVDPGHNRSSPQGGIAKDGSDHTSAVRGAPASAGHIHDAFAEYDRAFGKTRMGRDNPKLQQRSSTLHRSDSAPRCSITSDRAATSSRSETSQKAYGQLDFDKSVRVDACADTSPNGDAPTVNEAEHARDPLGKAGLQSDDANHSGTPPERSRRSRKRSLVSLPSSNGRASKRSHSSAIPTPPVSETDRSMSPPSKQAGGGAGKAITPSSSTGLGSHDEEYLLSAFAETVQDLGSPPAVVPEDNQYAVERLLESRVRRLGGRNRRQVTQYLVKWKGYGDKDNSWVDETDIHEGLIEAYAASTVSISGRPD